MHNIDNPYDEVIQHILNVKMFQIAHISHNSRAGREYAQELAVHDCERMRKRIRPFDE